LLVTSTDPASRVELEGLQFLHFLPERVRNLVIELLELRAYAFGDVIIAEGDPSDALFLLVEGTVRVVKEDEAGGEISLGRFLPGETFGETGLLDGGPRTATIRASSAVRVLTLEARVLQALMTEYPEFRVALEAQRRAHVLNRFLRTKSAFSTLTPEGTARLVAATEQVVIEADEEMVTEGADADALFVVQDGRLEAFTVEDGHQVVLRYLRTGDMFGETALEPGALRTASVRTVQRSTLLKIPAERLLRIAGEYPALAERIDELVRSRKRLATVPLDFAEELLPADARRDAPPAELGPADPGLQSASEDLAPQFSRQASRRRGRRRYPFVHQLDEMDCGAACLGMVARWYGRDASLTYLRQESGVSVNGTTLRGLQRGGEAIGIETRAFRLSPANLTKIELPAIVHWEGNHWVVLYQVDDEHVRIGDPAVGIRRLGREAFDRAWTGYAALLRPTPALAEAPTSSSGLRWLLPFLKPHVKTLVIALLLAVVAAVAEVAIPVLSQSIVDNGILQNNRTAVLVLGAALLLLAAVNALVLYWQRVALTKATVSIDVDSLNTLTETLLAVPMSYLETRRSGDIERRLSSMQQVNNVLTTKGIAGITAVVQLALILVVMFVYSVGLSLVFVGLTIVYVVLIRTAFLRVGPVYASLEHAFGQFASKQVDLLKGIQSVKIVGRRPGIRASISAALDDLAKKRNEAAVRGGRFNAAITGVGLATTAVFLFLGALWVLDGRFTLGQYVAFDVLVGLALAPAQLLAGLWDDVQRSTVLLHRLQDVFEQQPEQGDRVGQLAAVPTLGGRIELHRVSFSFDANAEGEVRDEKSYVLRDVDLEVPPGTTVGLVGRSGSGKSTLLKMLAGFFEPTSGTVLYDGVDLSGLDFGELRRRLGFVEQSPYLFNATVAENIAIGDPGPELAQVRRAAEAADAHAFVTKLPLGYETPLGDGGLRLSGGQAQRIAIARALYWEPDVMLLDEATSALDSESEQRVKLNLDRVLSGRTAFVVAHRLSTVRDADIIVVLDEGRVVEHGDHEALMESDGLYAYLYSVQTQID
jgi:ABC-type bacteriocin/lantibiotic exporter with double-glycine peptidase domain